MSFIRTFIAIQIPESIKNEIFLIQAKLRAAGKGISWTKADNIHLTLKFLGPTDDTLIDSIRDKISASIAGKKPFKIQVNGLGAFPTLKRPRIIWIGANAESDHLREISRNLNENLESLGFESEKRKFTAHLTIGRVKDARKISPILERMNDLTNFDAGEFMVEKIELIKSDLHPSGAIYTPLRKIMLDSDE